MKTGIPKYVWWKMTCKFIKNDYTDERINSACRRDDDHYIDVGIMK